MYTPDVAESLTGVLAQCLVLVHLNLSRNRIGDAVTVIIMFSGEIEWSHSGTEILAGVLRQCTTLIHLNFILNWIGARGAKSLQKC